MTNKQKQVIGIGALLSVAILAIGYFVLVKPTKSKVSTIQAQTASQNSANNALQQQISQLQAQQAGLLGKQVELRGIAQRIPSTPDQPGLIYSLQDIGKETGVDIASITPGTATAAATTAVTVGRPTGATATTTTTAGSAAGSASTAASTAPAAYQTIPITLNIQGNYSQMVMFMDKLENLKRLYLVKSLTLAPLKEGATSSAVTYAPDGSVQPVGDLSATVTGEVYMTSPDTTSIDLPALDGSGATGTASATTTTANN